METEGQINDRPYFYKVKDNQKQTIFEKMATQMKKTGIWILGLMMGFLLILTLLVRFTNGSIRMGSKVLFGYDEAENHFQLFEKKSYELNGLDGPYIIGDTLYEITKDNQLEQRPIDRKASVTVKVDNEDNDQFVVWLRDSLPVEPGVYDAVEKIIAISDIEGNFNAFSGFLIKHGVIDKDFNWIFGKGHLVLPGDFIDRGENVTQVLWLIYKLETQALASGGKVHLLLGNHEIINFQGDADHNEGKYKKAAMLISKKKSLKNAIAYMYSDATELGKWLRTKNVVEKVGDILFTHGGLSPELLDYPITIPEINKIARMYWDEKRDKLSKLSDMEKLIMGEKGPYWYRGLVKEDQGNDKISKKDLDRLLDKFEAQRIVVGHTVVKYIQSNYKGKVIAIDVRHGKEKYSSKTEGIYFENNMVYVVDGKGAKTKL